MKHQIIVRYTNRRDKNPALTVHLHRCITAALAAEGVNVPCEINVLVTDDEGIRAINNATRNIDSATDVLSFPMFQFTPGAFPEDVSEDIDPQTGTLTAHVPTGGNQLQPQTVTPHRCAATPTGYAVAYEALLPPQDVSGKLFISARLSNGTELGYAAESGSMLEGGHE